MEIYMIVAVDKAWGIGYENRLLFHIREDMKQFQQMTMGNVVVMGRKTLESLPGGKPLSGRINVVLSETNVNEVREKQEGVQPGEFFVVSSLEEMWKLVRRIGKRVFVIGGEQVYRECLPYAERVYLTKIGQVRKADAHFPDLETDDTWHKVYESPTKEEGGFSFSFCTYEKKRPITHIDMGFEKV